MSAIRLSLASPGASAAELLALARRCAPLDLAVWLGDPRGVECYSDDSYIMAAAAAAAAVAASTSYVRIGVWLTLRGSAHPLRLAEDIGVVDQLSSGRLDLGFVAPGSPDLTWRESVRRVLDSWFSWEMADGRFVAVTPPPAQLAIPATVLGDPELAGQLGSGCATWANASDQAVSRHRRNIAIYYPHIGAQCIEDWLAHDPEGRVAHLRAIARAAGEARELIFIVRPQVSDDDLKALGMFLAIALRATAGDRQELIGDAWKWLTQNRPMHGTGLLGNDL